MSEEYARHLMEKHFVTFYTEEIDSEDYKSAKGKLYEDILESKHIEEVDALEISRLLDKGEVAEAEQEMYDLLEGEE